MLLLSLVLAIATTCIAVVDPKDWVKDALIVTEKLIPSVLQENGMMIPFRKVLIFLFVSSFFFFFL